MIWCCRREGATMELKSLRQAGDVWPDLAERSGLMSGNRLASAPSSYLRHAADQPIDWYPWGEEAFEAARRANRPIFLSSGAVWCHWCHVMAKESFYDVNVAEYLNHHFVAIKLDRDERPDIDRRYQQAVVAIGGSGGWPLTVFLTPELKPFFGGSYFPPVDRGGRPAFLSVLQAVQKLHAEQPGAAEEFAAKVLGVLQPQLSGGVDELSPDLAVDAGEIMLDQADQEHGGFGFAPKFPMTGAHDFLLRRSICGGNPESAGVVQKTLARMAMGGIHDQLQGGFHRYSTDAGWSIPHFEKMADDNAWLLRNYLDAWMVFNDPLYRDAALGVIRFFREVMSAPEGGFYASQDADVTPDDEGGYFTWTGTELREALDDCEYELLSRFYLHQHGRMHHDPDRHVLSVRRELASVAAEIGLDAGRASGVLASGRAKLLAKRMLRTAPYIDTALYTSLNGLVIGSLLLAGRYLGDEDLCAFARRSLDRICALRYRSGELWHGDGVPAQLEDYVYLSDALIIAYEITASQTWLERAVELMKLCRAHLWDHDAGGFFDTETPLLGLKLKPADDMPHPAPNPIAARVMLRLFLITDDDVWRADAEATLRACIGRSAGHGLHAASTFGMLDALHAGMSLKVHAGPLSAIAVSARQLWLPYVTIRYGADQGMVIPCTMRECFTPIRNVADMAVLKRCRLGDPASQQ